MSSFEEKLAGTFLDELASSAPVPGGGGAAAYCGALASALAQMVGNLTADNPRYIAVEAKMQEAVSRLEELKRNLLHLVELDAQAFAPLAKAYKMPANTPAEIAEKDLAKQSALVQAAQVPLDVMDLCIEVLHICETMAERGSRMALSDAAIAALFAQSALLGSALNVQVNANMMTDMKMAEHFLKRSNGLCEEGVQLGGSVYASICAGIGAKDWLADGKPAAEPVGEIEVAQADARLIGIPDTKDVAL